MPSKTIYIKEEDVGIFNRAQDIGGESVSSLITEALRRYIADEELKRRELQQEEHLKGLLQEIFDQAFLVRASDIHLQPTRDGNQVSLRVDGVLRAMGPVERDSYAKLIEYIERQAGIEGTANCGRLNRPDKKCEVQVCRVTSVLGPSVAMRILDHGVEIPEPGELDPTGTFGKILEKQSGLIFVTGPTGSGKTTTLYSALRHLRRRPLKIMTLENPVERIIDGCVQLPVEYAKGATFSALLRAALCSDPDAIMVGEIRDVETAQLSMEAAITGRLVLSVLHTNSAPLAIARLLDFGIEPFIVRDAVRAVVGQMLLRRLCPACKQPAPEAESAPDLGELREKTEDLAVEGRKFFQAGGCEKCGHTGYQGRLQVLEMLLPGKNFQQGIMQRLSGDKLDRIAREEGMQTMVQDGLNKAAAGYTTIAEVMRIANHRR